MPELTRVQVNRDKLLQTVNKASWPESSEGASYNGLSVWKPRVCVCLGKASCSRHCPHACCASWHLSSNLAATKHLSCLFSRLVLGEQKVRKPSPPGSVIQPPSFPALLLIHQECLSKCYLVLCPPSSAYISHILTSQSEGDHGDPTSICFLASWSRRWIR